jgi:hypothetical protein
MTSKINKLTPCDTGNSNGEEEDVPVMKTTETSVGRGKGKAEKKGKSNVRTLVTEVRIRFSNSVP